MSTSENLSRNNTKSKQQQHNSNSKNWNASLSSALTNNKINSSKSKHFSNYVSVEDDYNYVNCASLEDDDYDDCKDIVDEWKKKPQPLQPTKSYNLRANINNSPIKPKLETSNQPTTRNPCSPMKRNNDSIIESPKKRLKMPQFTSTTASLPTEAVVDTASSIMHSQTTNSVKNLMMKINGANGSNNQHLVSPKKARSTSLSENEPKKSFASTPKSERKSHSTRVKELIESSSAAVERNLSTSWADIIEELEEQTKELNEYADKVSIKYKLDKDKLLKNLECDSETLRKRQKRINFGKVTPEYQRYILALPRKDRQSYHPRTPNKFRKCSRRKFDGLTKKWRKLLHVWDENPDSLPDYKNSIENGDSNQDDTDDFGGASNITASNFSYIVDDYDIIDDDCIDNK